MEMTDKDIEELNRLLPVIIALANLIQEQAKVREEARKLLIKVMDPADLAAGPSPTPI
jgi:hypothetical protein